jgi:hypothetical protein
LSKGTSFFLFSFFSFSKGGRGGKGTLVRWKEQNANHF